jgi:hypothetical protein
MAYVVKETPTLKNKPSYCNQLAEGLGCLLVALHQAWIRNNLRHRLVVQPLTSDNAGQV